MPTLKVLDGHPVMVDPETLAQYQEQMIRKMRRASVRTSFASKSSQAEENPY